MEAYAWIQCARDYIYGAQHNVYWVNVYVYLLLTRQLDILGDITCVYC